VKTPKKGEAVLPRPKPRPMQTTPALVFDIEAVCDVLRVSKPVVQKLFKSGELESFRMGTRRLTTPEMLKRCVRKLSEPA
jgi:excisionase family DNA binding protein